MTSLQKLIKLAQQRVDRPPSIVVPKADPVLEARREGKITSMPRSIYPKETSYGVSSEREAVRAGWAKPQKTGPAKGGFGFGTGLERLVPMSPDFVRAARNNRRFFEGWKQQHNLPYNPAWLAQESPMKSASVTLVKVALAAFLQELEKLAVIDPGTGEVARTFGAEFRRGTSQPAPSGAPPSGRSALLRAANSPESLNALSGGRSKTSPQPVPRMTSTVIPPTAPSRLSQSDLGGAITRGVRAVGSAISNVLPKPAVTPTTPPPSSAASTLQQVREHKSLASQYRPNPTDLVAEHKRLAQRYREDPNLAKSMRLGDEASRQEAQRTALNRFVSKGVLQPMWGWAAQQRAQQAAGVTTPGFPAKGS